jgi:hypothetical protein
VKHSSGGKLFVHPLQIFSVYTLRVYANLKAIIQLWYSLEVGIKGEGRSLRGGGKSIKKKIQFVREKSQVYIVMEKYWMVFCGRFTFITSLWEEKDGFVSLMWTIFTEHFSLIMKLDYVEAWVLLMKEIRMWKILQGEIPDKIVWLSKRYWAFDVSNWKGSL